MLGEWDTVKEQETSISDGLNENVIVAAKRKVSGDWIWEEVAGWPHSGKESECSVYHLFTVLVKSHHVLSRHSRPPTNRKGTADWSVT
jgi:hypothetical protein